ncbi:hypothetical protein C8Q75DRAFT_737770 [Abortiporus biennis]|nr:hypothetical protein C8Q75DRAFT_737770 [Abortiporus biennis]
MGRSKKPLQTKKASATVSLSIASVVSSGSSSLMPSQAVEISNTPTQSFIPFPSAPIDCHRSSVDSNSYELDISSFVLVDHIQQSSVDFVSNLDTLNGVELRAPPIVPPAWRRRRTKPSLPFLDVKTQSTGPQLKKSIKTPSTSRNSSKRTKRSRRQVADLQFVAMMHRTIAWRLRCINSVESRKALRAETDQVVLEQDSLLAERLWNSLAEQGLKPVLLERAQVRPKSTPINTHHSEPPSDHLSVTDIPDSPSVPCPSTSLPEVLPLPGLVAALILRYKDKHINTRPRCSGSGRLAEKLPALRPRSPLSKEAFRSD